MTLLTSRDDQQELVEQLNLGMKNKHIKAVLEGRCVDKKPKGK